MRHRFPRVPVAVAVAVAAVCAALALAPSVFGHAIVEASEPAAGSTVGTAPSVIRLTFGEEPDPTLSVVRVLDAAGHDHATGQSADEANPLELVVTVDTLPDGVYTVAWRAVSSDDGHNAVGSFQFGVGVSPPPAVSSATQPVGGLAAANPVAAVTRFLLYAGLMAMLGAGIVALFIVPGHVTNALRLGAGGTVLAAAGAAGVVAVQWAGAQADVGAILQTSLGATGLIRFGAAALGLVVGLGAWWPGRMPGRTPNRSRVLAAAGLIAVASGGMAVDVLAGHATAAEPALLQVAYQWAHVAAAGFWVGGLAAVLLVVRDIAPEERHAAARRFSVVAGFAIAIVAVTGAVRAIAEVGTLGALVSTDYGRILVIKSVLIVVLASLGATNHFWSVPVAGEHFSRLRRVGITELTVAIAAIALTAALVDLVPPVSVGGTPGPGVRPVVVSGTDAATGTRVRLVVTPGAAGTNEFAAAVTGGAGTPVDVSGVSLHFELTSTPGAVASDRSLARTGTGSFTGTGGDLSIDGIWRVTAAVTTASGHVSVPLVVPTVVADEAVDVNTSPGVPTIHVVHLTGGLTAQIYLDPETAGKTEAHATFFDGAGTELPVQSATIAIAPAAGPGQILEGRQLEPGHFVADVELPAGPLVVDVVGPDPATGAPIHVHLSMTVQP